MTSVSPRAPEFGYFIPGVLSVVSILIIVACFAYVIFQLVARTQDNRRVTLGKFLAISLGLMASVFLEPTTHFSEMILATIPNATGWFLIPASFAITWGICFAGDKLLQQAREPLLEALCILMLSSILLELLRWVWVILFEAPIEIVESDILIGIMMGATAYVMYFLVTERWSDQSR